MACVELVEHGRVVGHLCREDRIIERVPGRRRKSWWCFKCRKRLVHTLMRSVPVGLSYYGPNVWWECPKCHEENVLFPGREWVYDED